MQAVTTNPIGTVTTVTPTTNPSSVRWPKFVAEITTEGTCESLDINNNLLFRGQGVNVRNNYTYSIVAFDPETLAVTRRFQAHIKDKDDISIFFADEKYLASISTLGLGASSYIWDRSNGNLIGEISTTINFAHSGDCLVYVSPNQGDNSSYLDCFLPVLYNIAQGQRIGLLKDAKKLNSSPIIHNGKIYCDQPNGVIGCWDAATAEFITKIGDEERGLKITSLFVDDKIIVGVFNNFIKVWDKNTGALTKTIVRSNPPQETIYHESASFKNGLFYFQSFQKFEIWELESGKQICSLNDLIYLDSDDKALMFANTRAEIEIRNKSTGQLMHTLEGHPAYRPIDINSKFVGNYIVSKSKDGLKVWNRDNTTLLATITTEPVDKFVIYKQYVIAQVGNALKMWDLSGNIE